MDHSVPTTRAFPWSGASAAAQDSFDEFVKWCAADSARALYGGLEHPPKPGTHLSAAIWSTGSPSRSSTVPAPRAWRRPSPPRRRAARSRPRSPPRPAEGQGQVPPAPVARPYRPEGAGVRNHPVRPVAARIQPE
ncbi:hypothetical protein Slala01_32780 [Streptomyces lavendulae subsp. lavendulae]|nr:hypothetical protein Slala01_32780 [Streptomyces lavendulae subsp. lavendulae]